MTKRAAWRVRGFVLLVFCSALGTAFAVVAAYGPPKALEVAFWVVLFVVAYRPELNTRVQGVVLPGAQPRPYFLSSSFLVLLTSAFVLSPSTALLMGVAPAFTPWRGALRTLFNTSQVAIYVAAASLVFAELAKLPGGAASLVLAASLAAIVAMALNTTMVAAVMALERGRRVVSVLRELGSTAAASFAFAMLALGVAVLIDRSGPAAALLVIAPLLVLRRTRRARTDFEAALEKTLLAVAGAIDLKDPYTQEHSSRVAAITVAIHRRLGAGEQDLQRRYFAALLHDIGKVVVPGAVLSKPGRLTEEEFELIKRHPSVGAMTVNQVDDLRDVVPEVLMHHERLDGRGYPSGAAATDIPHEAQVLSVADTFEALTSDRPYRRALSDEDALKEMRRVSGSHLNGDIVDLLAKLVADGDIPSASVTMQGASARTDDASRVKSA